MLPPDIWRPWEPRCVFPIFGDAVNTIDFAVQESLETTWRAYARIGYALVKKQQPPAVLARHFLNAVLGRGIAFRGAFLDRKGAFVGAWVLSGPLQPGEFFTTNVNDLLRQEDRRMEDGLFVLIASRGRLDRWSSSPGSATVRYVGDRFIAGYRTGLFTRPLNIISGRRHVGFTGINPQVFLDQDIVASVLLINHSSEPGYDRSITPTVRLYKDASNFLEASFGEIPPHGALERTILDLFPGAEEFLANRAGRGFTIASAQGASLASLHLLRSRTGKTLGVDHSRPSYMNLVD